MSDDLFGLDASTRQKIVQVLSKHHEIDEVIVYGSRAKGNYQPGSDIDLSLKGENLTLKKLNRIMQEIDDLNLPYQLDISIYHQIDNPEFVEHIDRAGGGWSSQPGVTLLQLSRDSAVSGIGGHEELIEQRARRTLGNLRAGG